MQFTVWQPPKPIAVRITGWDYEESIPVNGIYEQTGVYHGGPVFSWEDEVSGQSSVVFYQDERDGKQFAGWWVAPAIGSDTVWAFHPDASAYTPPTSGWHAPPNGPVAEPFRVEIKYDYQQTTQAPEHRDQREIYGWSQTEEAASKKTSSGKKRKQPFKVEEDTSESEDERVKRQQQIKSRQAGIARVFGAKQAFAEADDPVYERTKDIEPPGWPMLVNDRGKVTDMPYGGEGVKLNFQIPGKTMRKLHPDDFFRVTKFICHKHDLSIDKYTKTEDGTAQISFGSQKGSGTVQLYLTSRSESTGNILIQIGGKEQKRVRHIRETLLRSVWFKDTSENRSKLSEKVAETALKEDGKVLMPVLDGETDERDYKKTVEVIRTVIGLHAKKAMVEYAKRSGVGDEHKIHKVIENTFDE
jgi:hypothetical protein